MASKGAKGEGRHISRVRIYQILGGFLIGCFTKKEWVMMLSLRDFLLQILKPTWGCFVKSPKKFFLNL